VSQLVTYLTSDRGFRQATRGADTGAFHHPFFRRDQPELCVKMVCQKSRDRQQGHQKQRSLPPKKRLVPDGAPGSFGTSHKAACSLVSSADSASISTSTRRAGQIQGFVTGDDRSTSTSSTTSQTSFSNSVGLNNTNNYIGSIHPSGVVPATIVPVATVHQDATTMHLKGGGGVGVIPFISNDTKFVASTLRQRESLEVYRAAKAMLYDAYIKAVNEEVL